MSRKSSKNFSDSALHFHLMKAAFVVRDCLRPRREILKELDIKSGHLILDYGCGPGSYIAALADLVGPEGKIYALDSHALAIKAVERIIARNRLTNVDTIRSQSYTALPDNFLDRILFYDILHYPLKNAVEILSEFHRILKPDGLLSVRDHHLKKDKLIHKVTATGLFQLHSEGKSCCFSKVI